MKTTQERDNMFLEKITKTKQDTIHNSHHKHTIGIYWRSELLMGYPFETNVWVRRFNQVLITILFWNLIRSLSLLWNFDNDFIVESYKKSVFIVEF